MTPAARAWLAERADGVPPALAARMQRAIDDVAGQDSIPAALEHAARSCLRDALDIGDDRAAALHLLAADALITYACEAVSDFAATDEHAVALDQLAVSTSPPQLAHLADAKAQVGQAPAGQAPNGDAPDGGDGNAPEGNAPEGNAPEGSAVS